MHESQRNFLEQSLMALTWQKLILHHIRHLGLKSFISIDPNFYFSGFSFLYFEDVTGFVGSPGFVGTKREILHMHQL